MRRFYSCTPKDAHLEQDEQEWPCISNGERTRSLITSLIITVLVIIAVSAYAVVNHLRMCRVGNIASAKLVQLRFGLQPLLSSTHMLLCTVCIILALTGEFGRLLAYQLKCHMHNCRWPAYASACKNLVQVHSEQGKNTDDSPVADFVQPCSMVLQHSTFIPAIAIMLVATAIVAASILLSTGTEADGASTLNGESNNQDAVGTIAGAARACYMSLQLRQRRATSMSLFFVLSVCYSILALQLPDPQPHEQWLFRANLVCMVVGGMLLGGALHALLLICQPNSHDPRINDLHRLDIACGASISIFVDAVLFRHLMSVYLEFLGANAAANPLAHGEMWMPVLAIFLRYSIRVLYWMAESHTGTPFLEPLETDSDTTMRMIAKLQRLNVANVVAMLLNAQQTESRKTPSVRNILASDLDPELDELEAPSAMTEANAPHASYVRLSKTIRFYRNPLEAAAFVYHTLNYMIQRYGTSGQCIELKGAASGLPPCVPIHQFIAWIVVTGLLPELGVRLGVRLHPRVRAMLRGSEQCSQEGEAVLLPRAADMVVLAVTCALLSSGGYLISSGFFHL